MKTLKNALYATIFVSALCQAQVQVLTLPQRFRDSTTTSYRAIEFLKYKDTIKVWLDRTINGDRFFILQKVRALGKPADTAIYSGVAAMNQTNDTALAQVAAYADGQVRIRIRDSLAIKVDSGQTNIYNSLVIGPGVSILLPPRNFGVTKLIAGAAITLEPPDGLGEVTVGVDTSNILRRSDSTLYTSHAAFRDSLDKVLKQRDSTLYTTKPLWADSLSKLVRLRDSASVYASFARWRDSLVTLVRSRDSNSVYSSFARTRDSLAQVVKKRDSTSVYASYTAFRDSLAQVVKRRDSLSVYASYPAFRDSLAAIRAAIGAFTYDTTTHNAVFAADTNYRAAQEALKVAKVDSASMPGYATRTMLQADSLYRAAQEALMVKKTDSTIAAGYATRTMLQADSLYRAAQEALMVKKTDSTLAAGYATRTMLQADTLYRKAQQAADSTWKNLQLALKKDNSDSTLATGYYTNEKARVDTTERNSLINKRILYSDTTSNLTMRWVFVRDSLYRAAQDLARIKYSDTTSTVAMQWELDGKKASSDSTLATGYYTNEKARVDTVNRNVLIALKKANSDSTLATGYYTNEKARVDTVNRNVLIGKRIAYADTSAFPSLVPARAGQSGWLTHTAGWGRFSPATATDTALFPVIYGGTTPDLFMDASRNLTAGTGTFTGRTTATDYIATDSVKGVTVTSTGLTDADTLKVTKGAYFGGNVGIGMTPTQKLEALGGNGSYIQSTSTQSGGANWAGFRIKSWSGAATEEWRMIGGALTGGGSDFVIANLSNAALIWLNGTTGNLGVGAFAAAPSAKVHVLSTTEQLRLGYDASNYMKFSVNSTGDLGIDTSSIGIGTLTPRNIIGTILAQRIVQIKDTNKVSRLTIVGTSTGVDLINYSGTANQRWVNFASVPGELRSRALNDNSTVSFTFFRSFTATGYTSFSQGVGIGIVTPLATLHSEATTEQLRLSYDASNYTSFTVGATGGLAIGGAGTNGGSVSGTVLLRDTSAFTTTGLQKAIYIAGALQSDIYVLTPRYLSGATPVAGDLLSYWAKPDSLVVTRAAGTTSELKFSFIRIR